MTETGKTNQSAQGKRILQELHDQGVIDLDAPLRQLLDKMDATGDVGGYQLTDISKGPEPDQWYVLRSGNRVLAGSDLKDETVLKD